MVCIKLTVEPAPIALDPIEINKNRRLRNVMLLLALLLVGFFFWQNGTLPQLWQEHVVHKAPVDHRIRYTKEVDKSRTLRFNVDDFAAPITAAQYQDSLRRSKRYDDYMTGHVYVADSTVLTVYRPPKDAAYSELSDMLSLGAVKVMGDVWPGTGNYVIVGHFMANPKHLFAPLQMVTPGQIITIAAEGDREWQYRVTKKQVLTQDDMSWRQPAGDKPVITLITSDSPRPGRALRLMVQGELVR